MKRLLVTAAAALTLIGPVTITPAFAQPGWSRDRDSRAERRDDRRNYNEGYREGRRDDRRDDRRWDRARDNGYYYRDRWYYGAPPAAYAGRPDYRPGYRQWTRGERIPRGYRVYDVDYRQQRLAPPPRGYHYVRDDRGDIILAAIATGIIASVILSH